ncbi:MAG: hypothetical protein N3A62_07895 [Thermodesulfovibrionales bacterium]|nr:hypothetical protein [Thermodesulfovibrionales bacterium]
MKVQANLLSQQYLPLLSKQYLPLLSKQQLPLLSKENLPLLSKETLPTVSGGQATLRSGMLKNQDSTGMVEMLESVETTVKNHELSHMVAGGAHSGAATYDYRRGPDGSLYAVAGGVNIDMTVTGSYEQVIEKMRLVKRAALSPAGPSFQDYVIAAKAIHIEKFEESKKVFRDFISKENSDSTISIYA